MAQDENRLPSVIASATEKMVFSVASEDPRYPGKRYRVELLANRGAGQCSCKNHAIKAQAALDQGMPVWTRKTSCKHTRKAARRFMIDLLADMAAREHADY